MNESTKELNNLTEPTTHLRRCFKEYIEECHFIRGLRPETIRGYTEVFSSFLRLLPEVQSIGGLSEEMILLLFKRLQTRERLVGKGQKVIGVKKTTLRTYGSKLHCFFDWLVKKAHLAKNPISPAMLPKPVFEDHRALKRDQVERIIAAVMSHSINSLILRRDLAIIYVLLFCGLRRTELLSLQVSDVDFQKGFLTVRGETSKSKKTRRLHIHPTLKLHLQDYMKERRIARTKTQYLFVSHGTGERFTKDGLRHWVKRLVKLSGVKFHVHRFRHTFATNLALNNVGVVKIQKLMGHSQLSMTEKYLRSIVPEDLSEDINKLSIENLQ